MRQRLYTYKREVRTPEGILHSPGDRVHQTFVPENGGQWRDTNVLHCVSGGYCREQHNCHCRNCRAYHRSK